MRTPHRDLQIQPYVAKPSPLGKPDQIPIIEVHHRVFAGRLDRGEPGIHPRRQFGDRRRRCRHQERVTGSQRRTIEHPVAHWL